VLKPEAHRLNPHQIPGIFIERKNRHQLVSLALLL
jgi:hypothetical protein